jgi:hypothetical protein
MHPQITSGFWRPRCHEPTVHGRRRLLSSARRPHDDARRGRGCAGRRSGSPETAFEPTPRVPRPVDPLAFGANRDGLRPGTTSSEASGRATNEGCARSNAAALMQQRGSDRPTRSQRTIRASAGWVAAHDCNRWVSERVVARCACSSKSSEASVWRARPRLSLAGPSGRGAVRLLPSSCRPRQTPRVTLPSVVPSGSTRTSSRA